MFACFQEWQDLTAKKKSKKCYKNPGLSFLTTDANSNISNGVILRGHEKEGHDDNNDDDDGDCGWHW